MYKFAKVSAAYQDLILSWFKEPHVNEFYYGEGLQNTLNNLDLYFKGINHNGDYAFDHWLAFKDDIPFGFLMTSLIEGPYDENDDYEKWYREGEKTYTLDLLIGEKSYLGQGLAVPMIQHFILDKFADANYFIIDPAKKNKKAYHVYEKAGFQFQEEFCPSHDPIPHMMMRLAIADLKPSS